MVRFGRFKDESGATSYGIASADGSMNYAEGCPFAGTLMDTGRKAMVKECLSPVDPPAVICIGFGSSSRAEFSE
jgi:hypothetical protein